MAGQRPRLTVSSPSSVLRPSGSQMRKERGPLIVGSTPHNMLNPRRWIAPRGAAARSKGLEPPTF